VAGTPAGTPASKLQRIRLKLSHPPKDDADRYSESANEEPAGTEDFDEYEIPEFSPEIGFDEHELSLPPQQLYRLLRRQIHWAEKEGVNLRDEWERIKQKRKFSFLEKEAIIEDVCDAELRLISLLMGSDVVSSAAPTNGVKQQPDATDRETKPVPESESVPA
jgi:hypothetical protein